MNKTFGVLLKEARHLAGLTQSEVAAKLKLDSAQYVSNCERGMCSMAPRHFRKLAKLYGIDVVVMRNHHLDDYIVKLNKKLRLKGV